MRTLADVEAIPDLTPDHVPFITEAVQGLVGELGSTPLIGFAGAPFTVASYLVEGGPSKEHARTKALMFGAPEVWDALMRKISGIAAAYLEVQVEAGASAVQLFDSWAGAVTRDDYRTYVQPWSAHVLERIGETGVPRIHFGVGTGEILDLMGEAGADVVGVDWRVPLSAGIERVGGRAVQGNLDPTLVFAPTEVMLERAREVLDAGAAAPGHIFNLGHGVIPSTDPDQLARLTAVRAGALGALIRLACAHAGRRRARRPGDGVRPSQRGTPSSASSTAKGSSAPTTVSATTVAPPSASHPFSKPGQEALGLLGLGVDRRGGSGRR